MNVVTVHVHEIEEGDVLFGLHTPMGTPYTDGCTWYLRDLAGMIIATRPIGSRVQVIRQDVPGSSDVRSARVPADPGTTDDCNPHGIARRFTVVGR